jgi:hypothetical protein
MWLARTTRGLVAIVCSVLPILVIWLLTLTVIKFRERGAPVETTPNPSKAPVWFLGPAEVLVYANPSFSGTMYIWLVLAAVPLIGLLVWAIGILGYVTTEHPRKPLLRLRIVAGASLVLGICLSIPWLYAFAQTISRAAR